MGTKQETSQSTTIGQMSAQDRAARNLIQKVTEAGAGQLGDLSDLASGNVQLSPQDAALINQINELSAQSARERMLQNYEATRGQVESGLLERGLAGSSIEAVLQATMGQQIQSEMNQQELQKQINTAQQLRQMQLDKAGLKLNANQLLLQQILGGAGQLASIGLNERLAQTTTKQTQKTGGAGQVLGQAAGLALAAFNPAAGAGALAGGMSGSEAFNALSSPYLTTDTVGD